MALIQNYIPKCFIGENGHYSIKILDRLFDIVDENHSFEEREGGKESRDQRDWKVLTLPSLRVYKR